MSFSDVSEPAALLPMEELLSILPDTWQNIPEPLKNAVSLLSKYLISFSQAHTQLDQTVKTQTESFSSKLKKTAKNFNSHIETLTAAGKRASDDRDLLEHRLNDIVLRLREEQTVLILQEQKARDQGFKEIEEKYEELLGKVTGLQNVLSTGNTELKTAIGNIKSATRYEIEEFLVNPEIKSVREEIKDLEFALKKADKSLCAKIEALEDYQKTTIQAKLDRVDKAVEATLVNLQETKNLEENTTMKIEEILTKATAPLETEIGILKEEAKTEKKTRLEELKTLQNHLEAFALTAVTKQEGVFQRVDSIVKTAESGLNAKVETLGKDLMQIIEEKERNVLTEEHAAMSALENRLMRLQESYVEGQIKDLRLKLAGMSPTEARLYTLEARLRNEENKRIQAVGNVQEQFTVLKTRFGRPRRLRTAERPNTTNSEWIMTPTGLGTSTADGEFRSVMSPGGMPSRSVNSNRRKKAHQTGLAVQSIARISYPVPLLNPFEGTSNSQKEILGIYKDFSPSRYGIRNSEKNSALGYTRELSSKLQEMERLRIIQKPGLGSTIYLDDRMTLPANFGPEVATSLPNSRETSPVRYSALQLNEAVQFEHIPEKRSSS